jgi:hypothetical protein
MRLPATQFHTIYSVSDRYKLLAAHVSRALEMTGVAGWWRQGDGRERTGEEEEVGGKEEEKEKEVVVGGKETEGKERGRRRWGGGGRREGVLGFGRPVDGGVDCGINGTWHSVNAENIGLRNKMKRQKGCVFEGNIEVGW